MHSYPWRDVFFSLRASICSVRHQWRHQRNTNTPANACEGARSKNSSLRRCQSFLCGAQRLQHVDFWWYMLSQPPVWTSAMGSRPRIRFHRAPRALTSDRTLSRQMRAVRPAVLQRAISDNYLWYSAFQTRAEQPGDNLCKHARCDYECIAIQQTGNQHAVTCRAMLQN